VSNKDGTTHTFTAIKGAFDTGNIDGGSSATVTVKKPGTYAYHCNIHNSMKGTIKGDMSQRYQQSCSVVASSAPSRLHSRAC
jgi:plastocyanin domain-containing protein